MALTYFGTSVELDQTQVPSGYTQSPVTKFNDPILTSVGRVVEILKSSVEDPDPVVTLTAIVADLDTAITTLINDNLDTGTNDYEAYSDFTFITTNLIDADGDLYRDNPTDYVCTLNVFIKEV